MAILSPATARPTPAAIVRHGALDLLSAAAFLGIWLARDRFEYDTLRNWLLWPVVFEAALAVAVFLGALAASFRFAPARIAWLLVFFAAYLGGAWLLGASVEMPQAWLVALWLWIARTWPPRGAKLATREHLAWLHEGAGISGLLWGAGFVATVVLMLVVPAPVTIDADGARHSATPSWIFPLVWTPYFVAEALLRAWRTLRRTSSAN